MQFRYHTELVAVVKIKRGRPICLTFATSRSVKCKKKSFSQDMVKNGTNWNKIYVCGN